MKTKILGLFTNLSLNPPKSFIEVFREFNRQDALISDLKDVTINKYEVFVKNLERYLTSINSKEITPDQMEISIVSDFNYWLLTNLKSCCKTHAAKHVERIKKAMDYAVVMKYAKYNSITSYKCKRDKAKEVIHLEDHEFNLWVSAEWKSEIYRKAQDLYIFSCTTGISYMDLFTYKTIEDPKTGLWIESVRGKTKKPFYVPLFHPDFGLAKHIHDKYNGKLPYLRNKPYNDYIREMAAVLGIHKYLTTHTGRKTFATRLDNEGYSMPFIASTLGNNEATARTHYVSPSKKKIERELLRRA